MAATHPRARAAAQGTPPGTESYLIDWRASLRVAERACCCPSRPAVVAIMPSGPDRASPAELLLCRHHYLVSADALAAAAAAVFDASGVPLTPHTRSLVTAASN